MINLSIFQEHLEGSVIKPCRLQIAVKISAVTEDTHRLWQNQVIVAIVNSFGVVKLFVKSVDPFRNMTFVNKLFYTALFTSLSLLLLLHDC